MGLGFNPGAVQAPKAPDAATQTENDGANQVTQQTTQPAAALAAPPTDEQPAAALVTAAPQSAALALGIDADTAAEWADEEDAVNDLLSMGRSTPTVAILYPTSPLLDDVPAERRAELVPGEFIHTATLEQKATLDLVMVYVQEQRAGYTKYKPGDDRPAFCFSLDGQRGEGSAEFDELNPTNTILSNDEVHSGRFSIARGTNCAGCAWGQWTGDKRHRTKPACEQRWRVIAYEREWGPIVFTVRGTSVKPFKQFRDGLASKANQARAVLLKQGLRLPSNLCVQFTMSAAPVENYYTLAPGAVRPIDRDFLSAVLASKVHMDAIRELVRSRDSIVEESGDAASEDDTVANAGWGDDPAGM